MKKPEVLIVGAGIAGPALAYWLSRERLPADGRRTRPAAALRWQRDRREGARDPGRRAHGHPPAAPRTRHPQSVADPARPRRQANPGFPLTSDKAPTVEVTRADLSEVLHRSAQTEAEFLFDDTVTALDQDEGGVDVTFRRSAPRRFDLVVGADGMHSTVRRLVFGPERQFSSDLGL